MHQPCLRVVTAALCRQPCAPDDRATLGSADAAKDAAMHDDGDETSGSRIDLASVPEPVRSMILKHLDRMTPDMREKLLRDGSPMLDRQPGELRLQLRACLEWQAGQLFLQRRAHRLGNPGQVEGLAHGASVIAFAAPAGGRFASRDLTLLQRLAVQDAGLGGRVYHARPPLNPFIRIKGYIRR
jgi:hypothetical protein